jgi:hypothetical protein
VARLLAPVSADVHPDMSPAETRMTVETMKIQRLMSGIDDSGRKRTNGINIPEFERHPR